MSATDDLNRLIGVLHNLNPRAVAIEVAYLRSGARSPKLGVIGHSADKPLPLPSGLDKRIDKQHKRYKRNLASMVRMAEENRTIQTELLTRLHLADGTPTEAARKLAEGDDGKSCEHCGNVVGKLYKDRCRNCYEHLKRHGVERPQNLIDDEVFGVGR